MLSSNCSKCSKMLCFFSLIQIPTQNSIVMFRNYYKTEFSSTTTAPGKSGNKNVNLREKYKDTKFPNEPNFVARSQILMFRF